ncbi:hypothetical protein LUZ60_010408 [Juncus effusus]|nr:hypothetical protein LUZ60_010408 [Juncus effusus]
MTFPRIKLISLCNSTSDHTPLNLDFSKGPQVKRFWRFDLRWLSNPESEKIVRESWGELPMCDEPGRNLMLKARITIKNLHNWHSNRMRTNEIKMKINNCKRMIELLDVAEEKEMITLIFFTFSRSENNFHGEFNFSNLFDNTSDELTLFGAEITEEEIKEVVFDTPKWKAVGPDGIPLEFWTTYWSIVKEDLMKFVQAFNNKRVDLKDINVPGIILPPKKDIPISPGDYRPISVISSPIKMLTKVLADRLSKVLLALVSDF